ncbi:common pilus major fimbrillin subunit EcpA [Acinetobacter rudis]|uniref:Common pilus major fimbrillin subunit EcpA n=1 Tax=Acinetobacter rudis TaxID=632955 RepID=A0AAW8J8C1_9GAMM|nr:common pilus major fimbrillin subunit EcpA [Acinetobacter rudis]MDQ8936406.1 common pilus major fimbrillin subunit EcpA [Acinetobacter rudis]MDQ8952890.1 common pilus major fimbrillin subunit EcpA [Acinetobacter rudis]MDQ9018643.1 common pilus major fimbrillin subunit EcpA [Acinetobacter rudis]
MKKLMSTLALTTISSLFAASAFADVTASATAKWDASATKDTKSLLVVTPLKSLVFQYAEGIKGFNTQVGAFDVTIEGQSGATDFTLTSKLLGNTLTRSGGDRSTLDVGVSWNGQQLSKSTATTMIDTANNVSAGLENLAVDTAYAGTGRSSAQSNFVFNVASAKSSAGAEIADLSTLTDGRWDGEVAVQFTALWKK